MAAFHIIFLKYKVGLSNGYQICIEFIAQERSLTELMDKETEMVRHIKALDSDMQTLVYENYNKFISATDTIRKVNKNGFKLIYSRFEFCLN